MTNVPSGNVTLTVDPGSPVPVAVKVPFGLDATASVGALGAVVSV